MGGNPAPADIAGGIAAVRAVFDLTKSYVSLKSEVDKNKAINEIAMKAAEASMALVEAQNELVELRQLNRILSEQNHDLRQFEAKKDDYALKRFDPDTYIYVSKDGSDPGYFCSICFDKSNRSRLVATTKVFNRRYLYNCHECGTEHIIGEERTD